MGNWRACNVVTRVEEYLFWAVRVERLGVEEGAR